MKTLFNILFIIAILWMILMFGMFFTGIIKKPCLKSSTQAIQINNKLTDVLICELPEVKIIKIF